MKVLSWTLVILFIPTMAFAGKISGGGGRGVVCRNSRGQIQSAETFDLYEGRVFYHLQIHPSQASEAQQIQSALQMIPSYSRFNVEIYVKRVLQALKFVDSPLAPIEDIAAVEPPKGCAIEQLANYYNDNLIAINREIWSALNATSRAALVLHEAIYAINRVAGATDSRQSRQIVASLFNPKTHWTDSRQGVPAGALNCAASNGPPVFFWAFKNAVGQWQLQFQVLGNVQMVTQATATVSDADFDLNEAKMFPVVPGEDKIGTSEAESLTLHSSLEEGDTVLLERTWDRVVAGYQTPHYWMTWTSANFPGTSTPRQLINCSIELPFLSFVTQSPTPKGREK